MPSQGPIATGQEFLAGLYDPAWFVGAGESRIFVRYYAIAALPRNRLTLKYSIEQYVLGGVPFRLAVADISGQDYKSHHPWLIWNEAGESSILVEVIHRNVPSTLYAVLSTPVSPHQNDWENLARSMDRIAAVMRFALGGNFLHRLTREAVVEIPSGKMTTPTAIVRVAQGGDGPFLEKENFAEFKEVLVEIERQPAEAAKRIRLALELFERGAQEAAGSKFFYYWAAVEVLCDTHRTAQILEKLVKAYGVTRSHVQNCFGFDLMKEIRTDLFHRGQPHDMPQDVERYVVAMFVDLVRHQLNLQCRRHMERRLTDGFSIERLKKEIGRDNVLSIEAQQSDLDNIRAQFGC